MMAMSLPFDIGQPYMAPLVMWNEHSAMFEVALCLSCIRCGAGVQPRRFEWRTSNGLSIYMFHAAADRGRFVVDAAPITLGTVRNSTGKCPRLW